MKIKVQRKVYYVKFWHSMYRTDCTIEDTKGKIYAKGHSNVSKKDQFSRPMGRKITIARAIANFEDKKMRKAFWRAYWEERERITGRKFAA